MSKISSLFIVLFITITSFAQVDFEPKGSFKIEIGLPNNMTNRGFKELVQGLAVVSPYYQYTFGNSLAVGGGLRYGYFNVNEFKNNVNLKGGLHITGAFLHIGQEKFWGNFGLNYGVRAGYTMQFFTTNKNKALLDGPYIDGNYFVEPVINLALKAGENSSYHFVLGYAFHGFKFNAEQVGLEEFTSIKPEKLNAISTYLSVGFGYSYYFGKK